MNDFEQSIMSSLLNNSYNISIRNAGVFRFPPDYRFEVHNHKETEIIYINSGYCVMKVENEFVPLKPGDCMSVSAGVPHSFLVDNRERCSITQLEFQMEMPGELGEHLVYLRQNESYYKIADCETIRFLMESICRIFRVSGDEVQKETQLDFGFLQLFIELSSYIQKKRDEQDKLGKADKIKGILQYINENYDTDIDLEMLSGKFGLSSRYIRKCFAKEAGISCQKYITMLRINKAKELLWFSTDSVTKIAMKTGFNSSQYFSRVFQQYMEMTPLEYRNLWRGSKAQELCTIEI